MTTDLMKLIETWRLRWSLLHVAVQLDQRWMPSLREQSAGAVEEAFAIARKLGGLTRDVANLGELRKHLLQQIVDIGVALTEGFSAQPARSDGIGRRRQRAEDVLFIARALDRSVGMRSGDLTVNPGAQRALWSAISATHDRSEPPRSGPDLMRQTCCHALSELDAWLEEERTHAPSLCSDTLRASCS